MMPIYDEDMREWNAELGEFNTKNLVTKWTRFCWWLSRKLGGRSIFGKQDLT